MIRKIEKLAYQYEEGRNDLPTVVFLPGFRSDMGGVKAQDLMTRCRARGQGCLLLDYSGHGASGGRFEDGSIGQWTQDALAVIDYVTQGKILVVGSSMGGWIGLHVALKRPDRVAGFIGLAAAPDFTRDIESMLTNEQKQALVEKGFFSVPSEYGDDLIITRKLMEDGERQCLLDHPIDLTIPVILIQGKKDPDVPWQRALAIKDRLKKTDAEIIFIEDGDHRLSRPQDLELIDSGVLKLAVLASG